MINDAIETLNISDRKKVIKTGDTVADILEGKNAGVLTVAVLTGTQSREELEKYNPNYIFSSISGLRSII